MLDLRSTCTASRNWCECWIRAVHAQPVEIGRGESNQVAVLVYLHIHTIGSLSYDMHAKFLTRLKRWGVPVLSSCVYPLLQSEMNGADKNVCTILQAF